MDVGLSPTITGTSGEMSLPLFRCRKAGQGLYCSLDAPIICRFKSSTPSFKLASQGLSCVMV